LVKNKPANDTYLHQLATTVCGSSCCIAVWTPNQAPTQGYAHSPCSNTPYYYSNDTTVAGCNVIALTTSTPVWVSLYCSLVTISFTDVSTVEGCDDTPFCAKTKNTGPTGLNIGPIGCATIQPCDCNSGSGVDCTYTACNFTTQSLFNTGVDGSGVSLPDLHVGDPHYTLTAVPSGTTQIMVRKSASGFPIPPWIGDSSVSAWIGPDSDVELDGPQGNFKYTTTFNLAAIPTSPFSFRASCDNTCEDVILNGNSIGAYLTPTAMPSGDFNAWYTYTIPVAKFNFFVGPNTIDFVVCNGGGPTGLRVEFL